MTDLPERIVFLPLEKLQLLREKLNTITVGVTTRALCNSSPSPARKLLNETTEEKIRGGTLLPEEVEHLSDDDVSSLLSVLLEETSVSEVLSKPGPVLSKNHGTDLLTIASATDNDSEGASFGNVDELSDEEVTRLLTSMLNQLETSE